MRRLSGCLDLRAGLYPLRVMAGLMGLTRAILMGLTRAILMGLTRAILAASARKHALRKSWALEHGPRVNPSSEGKRKKACPQEVMRLAPGGPGVGVHGPWYVVRDSKVGKSERRVSTNAWQK